jgi:hypothetical protein
VTKIGRRDCNWRTRSKDRLDRTVHEFPEKKYHPILIVVVKEIDVLLEKIRYVNPRENVVNTCIL